MQTGLFSQTGPQRFTLKPPEVFLELNTKELSLVKEILDKKEKIYYAGKLEKINKHGVVQERLLVVTNTSIYNIKPNKEGFSSMMAKLAPSTAVKRKIDIKNVSSLVLSVNPISEEEEFVIKVNKEHDYRYNGRESRENVFKSILNSHFGVSYSPFEIYTVEQDSLAEYCTNDDEVNAKKDTRPKDGFIMVTPEVFARGLGWILLNRRELQDLSKTGAIETVTYQQRSNSQAFVAHPSRLSLNCKPEVPVELNFTGNQPSAWNEDTQNNDHISNSQPQNPYQAPLQYSKPSVPTTNYPPQPQPQPQPHVQPQSQTQPQYQTQPQPQPKPQPQSQAQPQYQAQPQAQSKPQSQSQAQPQFQAQPQAQPKPQTQPQFQPQSQSQSQPQPQSQPQFQAQTQPQYQSQPQPQMPQQPQNFTPQQQPFQPFQPFQGFQPFQAFQPFQSLQLLQNMPMMQPNFNMPSMNMPSPFFMPQQQMPGTQNFQNNTIHRSDSLHQNCNFGPF